jgi:hypothetical protein
MPSRVNDLFAMDKKGNSALGKDKDPRHYGDNRVNGVRRFESRGR